VVRVPISTKIQQLKSPNWELDQEPNLELAQNPKLTQGLTRACHNADSKEIYFLYYLQFYKRIGNKSKNSHLPARVGGQFAAHVNLVCNLTHMYFIYIYRKLIQER
jgi:hypothetical protein